jgi:hypothetical protein
LGRVECKAGADGAWYPAKHLSTEKACRLIRGLVDSEAGFTIASYQCVLHVVRHFECFPLYIGSCLAQVLKKSIEASWKQQDQTRPQSNRSHVLRTEQNALIFPGV